MDSESMYYTIIQVLHPLKIMLLYLIMSLQNYKSFQNRNVVLNKIEQFKKVIHLYTYDGLTLY